MQLSLLDQLAPASDDSFRSIQRRHLGRGAWVDFAPGWLSGQHELFELLINTCDWETHRRTMYNRIVEVPRLVASAPGARQPFEWDEGEVETLLHRGSEAEVQRAAEELTRLAAVLSVRYQRVLSSVTLGLYRNGRDSVSYHGDKMGSLRGDTIVAIVSVGVHRNFLLRPGGGGESVSYRVGGGDLMVMGGSCQRTFEHAVPKMNVDDARIAIMFREAIVDPVSAARQAHWMRRAEPQTSSAFR